MEYLPGGLTLQIPPEAFPLSTDSLVLAHFARLPKNAKVLDLGSGCGTLGLLLCARSNGCSVTGVEIDPAAHEAALHNIAHGSALRVGRNDGSVGDGGEVVAKGRTGKDGKAAHGRVSTKEDACRIQ